MFYILTTAPTHCHMYCKASRFAFTVAPLIGRYCGTKIPPEIQSSSGLLSLSFHTDMAVAKDGFSARYNLTRKEVRDCECRWLVCFFSVCVGMAASVFFSRLFPHFQLHHLCWHSSFTPLTPSIFTGLPTLMLFQSRSFIQPSTSSERTLSQKQIHSVFFRI